MIEAAVTIAAVIALAASATWLLTRRSGRVDAGPDPAFERLVEALIEEGFLDRAPASERDRLRQEIIARGDFVFEAGVDRLWPADAEEIAEGGAAELVEALAPMLEGLGWRVGDVRDDFDQAVEDGVYPVTIEGRTILLYNREEVDRPLGDPRLDVWTLASARLLTALNEGLAGRGSDERLYGLYSGNDLHVVLLTPRMREVMAESGLFGVRELPWDPRGELERSGEPPSAEPADAAG